MPRVAAKVTSSEQDIKELTKLSVSRTAQARLVERARIVLGCLAGERNDQIALRMGVQSNTVATWRRRFLDGGVKALEDMVERLDRLLMASVNVYSTSDAHSDVVKLIAKRGI